MQGVHGGKGEGAPNRGTAGTRAVPSARLNGCQGALQNDLESLKTRAQKEHVDPAEFATDFLFMGDKERTFAWLEKAYREKSAVLQFLKVDTTWDTLRSDQRFQDLLHRMNFPPD